MRLKTISLVLFCTQLYIADASGGVRIRKLEGGGTNGSASPPAPSPETPPPPPSTPPNPTPPPPNPTPPPPNPPPPPPNPSPPPPNPSLPPPSPSPPQTPPPNQVPPPPPTPSNPPTPPPTPSNPPTPPPSDENNEKKIPSPPSQPPTHNPPPPPPPRQDTNPSTPKQPDPQSSPTAPNNMPNSPPPSTNPTLAQTTQPNSPTQSLEPQSQAPTSDTPSGTPLDSNATSKKNAMNIGTVAGIVAGIVGGVAFLAFCTICFLHRKKEMEDDPLSPFGASMEKGFQATSQESYNNIESRNHAPEPHPYAIPMDHAVDRSSQHRYFDAVTGPLTSPLGQAKKVPPRVIDRIGPNVAAPNLWVSAMESQTQDVDEEDVERRSSLPTRKDSYVSARDSSITDAKSYDQNTALPASSPYSQGSYDGIPSEMDLRSSRLSGKSAERESKAEFPDFEDVRESSFASSRSSYDL